MILALALTLTVQTNLETTPTPTETPIEFADGVGHIGSYIPNAQLLSWCTSKANNEALLCSSFIKGVVDTSGMIDVRFPKGPIDTSGTDPASLERKIRDKVIVYLKSIPPEQMVFPAARSVYSALVADFPYTGVHQKDIPYDPNRAKAKQP